MENDIKEEHRVVANYTPLWPVPFGWANLGESFRELNKQLVKDIDTEKSIEEGKRGTFTNNNLGWQSKNQMEHKYDSFAQLIPSIMNIATPLMYKSGIHTPRNEDGSVPPSERANVANLWANMILGRGGYAFPHTHGQGDTLWTGVYYPKGLQGEENLDKLKIEDVFSHGVTQGGGTLVIRDNNNSKELVKALPPANRSEYYERNFSVVPRESLLILFPAWLEHMVTPTENDVKRYSISFGIFREKYIDRGPMDQSAAKLGWATSTLSENIAAGRVPADKQELPSDDATPRLTWDGFAIEKE